MNQTLLLCKDNTSNKPLAKINKEKETNHQCQQWKECYTRLWKYLKDNEGMCITLGTYIGKLRSNGSFLVKRNSIAIIEM